LMTLYFHILRGETFKSMHICLATDVTTTASAKGHSSHTALKDMIEHVLCSIKLYQSGLLEVTPGLSGPVSETEGVFLESKGLASNRVAMSAFLDDNSVERAMASGFKLSTSSIRSKNGVEYEYCIQNVNDLLVPYQLEEILKRQNLLDMRSHTLNKCSAEHTNWTQDPAAPGRQKIYTIYAEIVSGENFTGKKIFLNYQVQVPQGWDLRTGSLNDGVSEKHVGGMSAHRIGLSSNSNCSNGLNGRGGDGYGIDIGSNRAGDGAIGLSGADVLALDAYSDGIDAQGMLRGTTHTATSHDSKPHSRRNHVTYALEQGARIFLGSSFFIITVISIILGLSYPFWLVPALVILFTLGTGIPAGGVEVVPAPDTKKFMNSSSKFSVNTSRTDDKTNEKESEQEKEWQRQRQRQKRISVTHSHNASVRHLRTPLMNPSTAHFNHLITLSFDVKDVTAESHTHTHTHAHTPIHTHTPGVFQDTPTIHFQVYSVTGMGRQILEGYGIFKIQCKSLLQRTIRFTIDQQIILPQRLDLIFLFSF
jgi:Ciliary basal body-associated, B9 protein